MRSLEEIKDYQKRLELWHKYWKQVAGAPISRNDLLSRGSAYRWMGALASRIKILEGIVRLYGEKGTVEFLQKAASDNRKNLELMLADLEGKDLDTLGFQELSRLAAMTHCTWSAAAIDNTFTWILEENDGSEGGPGKEVPMPGVAE